MPLPSRVFYPVKPKAERPFPKRIGFVFGLPLALIALGWGLWYVANLPSLAVDRIEVLGAVLLRPSEIEAAVGQSLAGKVWAFVPKDNFFFVSGEEIEHELRRQFPKLAKIDVAKRFPNSLVVRIEERELWGVYCERSFQQEQPNICFYLDADGTAYEELSFFEGWLLPVIYSAAVVRVGEEAVTSSLLEFYDQAGKSVFAINSRLIAMTMSTTTPYDVRLQLAEGWQLWVTATRPIEEWLEVLKTVLEKEIASRRSDLEYIDLRFGNKVFYKYRQ